MARKKASGKKSARKKKSAAKSAAVRSKKVALKKKAAASAKKLPKRLVKSAAGKRGSRRRIRGRAEQSDPILAPRRRGLGPDAGGQSGDIQGLRGAAFGDSESVEELVEDGQAFEAEVISGVEGAPDPDQGEIRTREVPEDDVPSEYLDNQ